MPCVYVETSRFKEILVALPELPPHNWLITDLDCYDYHGWDGCEKWEESELFLTDEEFRRDINLRNMQILWGVFSAIPVEYTKEDIYKYSLPESENPRYLSNHIVPQHPLAILELYADDGWFTYVGISEGYPGGTFISLTQVKKGEEHKIGMMFCDEIAFEMYGLDFVDKRTDNPVNTLWVTQKTYDAFKANGADLDDPDLVKRIAFSGPDSRFGGILSDFALTDALSIENDMWCEVSVFSTEDYCPFMSDGAGIVIKTAGNHNENSKAISEVYRNFSEDLRGVYIEPKDSGYINDLRTAKLTSVHNQSKIMNIFMFLSVLLSFMGLVAMSTYYSDEGISDIAIRKVYGSTVEDETVSRVWSYTKIIVLSCVIAIPVAVYACGRYLDNFVYCTDNAWWIFVMTTLAIVVISVAAVFTQTLRAARTNPAEALKKE